ncbi:MAG: pyridoxamine 5'-phosphate oxidase family protein, partial [Candidatus Kapaibacteriota bacterium]
SLRSVMAQNYAEIAFTDEVKELQKIYGSRSTYARMEQSVFHDGLTDSETDFIRERDSFYMATVGESGYPYIQHRGGPKGFLRVIDKHTLGFVDFRGNKQYISVGNISTHNKVSLFLMDYARQTRLKIYAEASIVALENEPQLLATLQLGEYSHKAERMMLFYIQAFDWNCPQHITPRYTAEEVAKAWEIAKPHDYSA